MRLVVRHPKDFWAGLIFTAAGLGFGFLARDYEFGTTTRMGPGYFPIVLACLLVILGLVTTIRAFVITGPPVQGLALKAILLVLGPIVLFGIILRGAGLAAALLILVMVCAYASSRFRWPIAVALSVGLTAFALLVFVMGLGLPIPVIGRWFS
ncbi:MAG TPA: tripartite tricarboxylate transporter TctB family protein [Verrucomicrobiae bacterium]|nr:tripartite tricarboxylate transporter TctB family protein [Verrucomicrobiae bacterium]